MRRAEHLDHLLRETNIALQKLEDIAARKPDDIAIQSNLAAIRKRKTDLEQRALEAAGGSEKLAVSASAG